VTSTTRVHSGGEGWRGPQQATASTKTFEVHGVAALVDMPRLQLGAVLAWGRADELEPPQKSHADKTALGDLLES
jgi:hypothetical protein